MTESVRRVALAMALGAGALLGATDAHAQTENYDRRAHLQVTASGGLLVGRQRGFVPGLALRFFTSRGHGVMARFERATLETPTYTTSCGGCVETTFTLFDIAYAHRWTVARTGSVEWIASLYEGLSIGPRTMVNQAYNQATVTESGPIDAGAVFGASVDLRISGFTVGVDFDLRLLATFGHSLRSDDTLVGVRFRLGGDFAVSRARRVIRRRAR
jgi:hypothetical protein